MITLLHLLSYAGGLAAFLFVTLSLASGLLWLAELIEEHSRYAKTIGIRSIYVIIVLHALLYMTDSLPFLPLLFSIASHLVYLQNFSTSWPYISLTSPKFLLSCVLVVADHFIWFFHFAAVAQDAKRYRPSKHRYTGGSAKGVNEPPTFMDVAAFFAICVWFVPLFLFLSLSANDNVLPSSGGNSAPASPMPTVLDITTPSGQPYRTLNHKRSQPLMKSVLNPLVSLLPRIRGRGRRSNAFADEGLIAPRTPVRGSPLHSPVSLGNNSGGYFPWNGNANANSEESGPSNYFSMTQNSLTPESARHIPTAPAPPRRVQSEAQLTKGNTNPRGIATRNGLPVVSDSLLGEEHGAGTQAVGLGSGGRKDISRPPSPSPAMRLASGNEKVGASEVVERPKKKAD